jgi:hypothetical protein
MLIKFLISKMMVGQLEDLILKWEITLKIMPLQEKLVTLVQLYYFYLVFLFCLDTKIKTEKAIYTYHNQLIAVLCSQYA